MVLETNFNAECQFIPGYTGFCPEMHNHIGSSYGRITQEVISSWDNDLAERLSDTKCPETEVVIQPTVCQEVPVLFQGNVKRENDFKIAELKSEPYSCERPRFNLREVDVLTANNSSRKPFHQITVHSPRKDNNFGDYRRVLCYCKDVGATGLRSDRKTFKVEEAEVLDLKDSGLCSGDCTRNDFSSMRAAGLPSDWEEIREDQRNKRREERIKQHQRNFSRRGKKKSEHLTSLPYKDRTVKEVYDSDPENDGYPVSLMIHLPNCQPNDKIEMPRVYRDSCRSDPGFKKNYISIASPCRPKRNIVYYPQKQGTILVRPASGLRSGKCRKPIKVTVPQDRLIPSIPITRIVKDKSSAHRNVSVGRGDSSPRCVEANIKVIPKYTGYITGLRWTYGDTYGKAAERLLGNRPEGLEKYIVCDS